MVTLYYNPVDGINIDKIISDIDKYLPQKIVIFNELEWEIRQFTLSFMQYLKDRNIEIEIVFGSFNEQYYVEFCNYLGIKHENLTFWNTYWINWTEICLHSVIDYNTYKVDTNFKYPFICLNNKNHIHREALIDHLTKYNLLESGIVTWHKFSNARHGYEFKYYDDSIRTIDDEFNVKLDSFLLPKQWHESFLHVIGEATCNVDIISEKTVIPMLMKKPFVSIAKQNHVRRLTELGFKLYDEIIDYSYDNYNDLSIRADLLCKNISKIPTNYSDLYEILRPKIEYNYNRCLEIIKDKSFIPKIVINRVSSMNLPNYIPMHTDHRYERIVRACDDS
jgi:hypothetical protein